MPFGFDGSALKKKIDEDVYQKMFLVRINVGSIVLLFLVSYARLQEAN